MELLEEPTLKKTLTYPHVYWGKQEKYGLASVLLILIERDPKIRNNLYPQYYNPNNRQKLAQCKELAKTLFCNIPEINVHLQNPCGLERYTISVAQRLRRWEESFINVLLTMPHSSNWPDQDIINSLCPSFVRLAPLLWGYVKTHRKFNDPDVLSSIARSHLLFCTAITLYDPQCAAAQLAAQNAVLRQLRDPPRSRRELPISYGNSPSKPRLPRLRTYYSPQEGSTALLARKTLSATQPQATQSDEHKPQTSRENSIPDTAVLAQQSHCIFKEGHKTTQQISRYDEKQARNEALQPLQNEEAAQQITTDNLGNESDRLDKSELREMQPLFEEQEPQANRVYQLELELIKLKGRTAVLESMVIGLVGGKRRGCSSQQDQQDAAYEFSLAKKQRRHERFEEPIPQTEQAGYSSRGPKSKAYWYFHGDEGRLEEQRFNRAPSVLPQQDYHGLAREFATETRTQVNIKDEPLGSTHSPHSEEKHGNEFMSWKDLDEARLRMWRIQEAEITPNIRLDRGRLEEQRLHRAPSVLLQQDYHGLAKEFPTETRTQVNIKDEALGSTHSPHSEEKHENEFMSWKDLDEARLRMWSKQEAETTTPNIRLDLDTVVKDERRRNGTFGFVKHEPLSE